MTGEQIRELREALDLTQREFADLLDADPQSVSRWERGAYRPRRRMRRKLSKLWEEHTSEGAVA